MSVGIDDYRNIKLMEGTRKERTARDDGTNRVFYFAVDGSPVDPRRAVVAVGKCNACHFSISLHGGNRNRSEHCVQCHNPTQTDAARRAPGPTARPDDCLQDLDPPHPHRGGSASGIHHLGRQPIRAAPITFQLDGRQYIAMASGMVGAVRGYTGASAPWMKNYRSGDTLYVFSLFAPGVSTAFHGGGRQSAPR